MIINNVSYDQNRNLHKTYLGHYERKQFQDSRGEVAFFKTMVEGRGKHLGVISLPRF